MSWLKNMHDAEVRELVGDELYKEFRPMPTKLLRKRRRDHNRAMYPSEKWFRELLLKERLPRFERNYPIARRIFGDFVFLYKKIVIEIDGNSHIGREDRDAKRDEFCRRLGITVFRIPHNCTKTAMRVIEELRQLFPPLTRENVREIRKNTTITGKKRRKRHVSYFGRVRTGRDPLKIETLYLQIEAMCKDNGWALIRLGTKETLHLRIENVDYWPFTGRFYQPSTKTRGRGLENLKKLLPPSKSCPNQTT